MRHVVDNTLQYSAYFYIEKLPFLGLHDRIVELNSPYIPCKHETLSQH